MPSWCPASRWTGRGCRPKVHEHRVFRRHAQRVRPTELLAAIVEHAQDALTRRVDEQALDHRGKIPWREAHRRRQSRDRPVRLQSQAAVDEIGRIAPLVVGLDAQAKRLAHPHQRRQHGTPAHARPGHDGDLRAFGQGDVVIGGDRVGKDAELELALAVGLQADAGRALPAVAEADGDGVAGAEEVLHHADVERAAPGANIALELPLGFQRRAVGGLHRGVALAFRIGELHGPEVGGEAEADLDRAGVIDPEGAGRIDEREALQRARLEAARRCEPGRPHEIGTVVGVGHGLWLVPRLSM